MAKLQAKKIAEALKKAQQVGEVEEAFSITGCDVVLRSLRQDEYEAAMSNISELEDIAYVQAFKVEHLCRAMVEVNGSSLREYDFVEVDVEETDNQNGKSAVKSLTLERAQFVKDYVLSTWSREAIDVAFRKFNDVVAKAEKVAADNVTFEIPEESEDDKYRRLLGEAKTVEPGVPLELAAKIRDEFGYLLKQEWSAVEEKIAMIKQDEEEPKSEVKSEAPPLRPSTAAILRPSRESAPTPEPAPEPEPIPVEVARKSAQIQQVEGDPDPAILGTSPQTAYNPHAEPRLQRRNADEVKQILDQPPVGGINPRFRPPSRV